MKLNLQELLLKQELCYPTVICVVTLLHSQSKEVNVILHPKLQQITTKTRQKNKGRNLKRHYFSKTALSSEWLFFICLKKEQASLF
jgi:hypothetical protein